jgi:hypothetical protein
MNLLAKPTNLLPVLALGTCLLQLSTFGVNIISLGKVDKLSRMRYLSQTLNGRTHLVRTDNQISPKVIEYFTSRTMVGVMTTRVELILSSAVKSDTGVQLKNGKVTTSTYNSSFGLSEDFRQEFLDIRSKDTPPGVFTGNIQQLLLVEHLSKPQAVGRGKWKLDMVAQLLLLRGKVKLRAIPFHRTIFVRSVEIPTLPPKPTKLEQIIFEARKEGLEIYLIKELK